MKKIVFVLGACTLLFTACLGKRQDATLEGIQGRMAENSEQAGEGPFVEAYIEYTGPQSKWAGPPTFVMHVKARENETPMISVTPNMFNTAQLREPSSLRTNPGAAEVEKDKNKAAATVTLKPDAIRERLADFAEEVQDAGDGDFKGCLYPVRVWLIRSSGVILEKHGCREHKGWVTTANELVSDFIGAIQGPRVSEAAAH